MPWAADQEEVVITAERRPGEMGIRTYMSAVAAFLGQSLFVGWDEAGPRLDEMIESSLQRL